MSNFKRAKTGSGFSQNYHVKSLENPFDTSNGQPKYPDGKATYSVGRRHQATSEVILQDFVVILFPGSVNWCLVLKPAPEETVFQNEIWANHSTNVSVCYSTTDVETTPWAPDLQEKEASADQQWDVGMDGFSKWRPVAYAMHLQLLNTTDRNEGWYEAIRTDKNSLMNRWGILRGIGSPLGNGNFIRGTPHFHMGGVVPGMYDARNLYTSRQWQTEPTYVTGELQDLHNAVFQLNSIKEDNRFRELTAISVGKAECRSELIWQRDDVVTFVNCHLCLPFERQSGAPHDAYGHEGKQEQFMRPWATEQLVADSFDVIILRVHGSVGTKVLIHSVANQEFMCAENSQFSQYATACSVDLSGLKYYNWMRNTRFKYPFHYLAQGGFLGLPKPPYY